MDNKVNRRHFVRKYQWLIFASVFAGLWVMGMAAFAGAGAVAAAAPMASAPAVPSLFAVNDPMSLTLYLPAALGVPVEGSRLLDLWDLTDYSHEKTGLVYTVTQINGSSLDVHLENGHYISMTDVSGFADRSATVRVEVSDPLWYAMAEFEAVTDEIPDLEFYGFSPAVPAPYFLRAGQVISLQNTQGAVTPLYYFLRAGEASEYLIAGAAEELGASIVTGTLNCPYEYCDYLQFAPQFGLTGVYTVDVEVWNYSYLSGHDVMSVTLLQQTYLPLVLRNYSYAPILEAIDNGDGDGDYWLHWDWPTDAYISRWETEFSFNDPTFANGQKATVDSVQQHGYFTWPGVHYWRVRGYYWEGSTEVAGPWSVVRSTTVGNFAYLYLDNPSYAFNMKVTVSGNGVADSITYDTRTEGFWRSVPVAPGGSSYQIVIDSDYVSLCAGLSGSQRVETRILQNTIEGGAWYYIDPCETQGPKLTP